MVRRSSIIALVAVVCVTLPAVAQQAGDADRIIAAARAALGGEKRLTTLKTFAATGQAVRVVNDASSAPGDTEIAFELPDKFMKKEIVAVMGPAAVTRTSGFNGDTVINVIDQPPAMGGAIVVRFGSGPGGGEAQTPEQREEQRQRQLLAARQDFARLALGMFVASPANYPLQFSYFGQAESPDGKADVLDVRGEGEFAARLFIDSATHLPLMLSWKAREPIMITNTISRGGPGTQSGGHGNVMVAPAGGVSQKTITPEERDKMMKQLEEQRKEAEAKARVVEYRLYYGDYRNVDGIQVPFHLQRSIDGKPTEEVTLEKVKINGKIDPKKFETM
jgi:hypothetical protein